MRPVSTPAERIAGSPEGLIDVVIVGAGFAGLGMAMGLVRAGHRDFVLLDKDDGPGGTWRVNTYPGCACDVPSHLYSFSFHPKADWSRAFAPQAEILAYLEDCVRDYGLAPHCRFNTEVTGAVFDTATGTWEVSIAGAPPLRARHLVLGLGGLSRPLIPELPGAETFAGPAFHTARWRHDVPLAGKDVAVIGTGASAIQAVPQLAKDVRTLDLYQRTPPWVLPKPDRAFSDLEKRLFAKVPAAARALRWATYWQLELRALGFAVDPRLMAVAKKAGLAHLEAQVPDPELRARLTPTYTPGCKRILMANDYYPALGQPNVRLQTSGITRIAPGGIHLEDGTFRRADAIVWATGFRVTELLTPLPIVGSGGEGLNARWQERAEAWLGTMVAGFPNLFVLTGPNTGLGHNSMVFMIESQVRLILSVMAARRARGAAAVGVRQNVQDVYNRDLQRRLSGSVWSSGCASWYLDANGHNSTLWPGFTFDFRRRTARLDPRDLEWFERPDEVAPARPLIAASA
jgi:cation diffusion facilitator CzcD-associated flavoprotein CzcO